MTIHSHEPPGIYADRVMDTLRAYRHRGDTPFHRMDRMIMGELPIDFPFIMRTLSRDIFLDIRHHYRSLRHAWVHESPRKGVRLGR